MTTALTEDLQEALADKARREKMIVGSNHTNVFVVIDFAGSLIIGVYGPFRSRNAGKDWGLMNSSSFTVAEILRPEGLDEIAFVLKSPSEPTLEDQGIHPDQTQIGDYIDPNIGRG